MANCLAYGCFLFDTMRNGLGDRRFDVDFSNAEDSSDPLKARFPFAKYSRKSPKIGTVRSLVLTFGTVKVLSSQSSQ